MNNGLYTVYDRLAGTLVGGIIRVPNDEVARRAFHDNLSQKDSPLAAHPQDYELLFLSSIDTQSGIITNHEQVLLPRVVTTGKEWLEANNSPRA